MAALVAAAPLEDRHELDDPELLFQRGDFDAAADALSRQIAANPNSIEARYRLYSALKAAGRDQEAAPVLDAARNLHALSIAKASGLDLNQFATNPEYCAKAAAVFYDKKVMAAASLLFGRGLSAESVNLNYLVKYALALQHQGRFEDAITAFKTASDLGSPGAHQLLLYALLQHPDRNQRLYEEAQTWAERYAQPTERSLGPIELPSSKGRRLRVGYVAPNPTRSQIATSMLPVLEAHDPDEVDVTVYCSDPADEAPLPPHIKVKGLRGISDEDAARLIRDDQIDVLVDVWGHHVANRLRMFMYRPAPVQAAWINFMHTTGLPCMDYVLHADSLEVPGTEAFFTETIWRTGSIMAPYRTLDQRLGPTPTPALANGFVTFASYNHPSKLSETTVDAWARILRACPADRLVLKYSYFYDPILQRATRARFEARGVSGDQIFFEGHSVGEEYVQSFAAVDLALDPSPCPGGTTTMNFIANGVPVLALKGDDFYARTCLPLLLPCGLNSLVAEDWDEYVSRAISLAADLGALSQLRASVQPGFDRSPYRDEIAFTRRLEQDFRRMFEIWRQSRKASTGA